MVYLGADEQLGVDRRPAVVAVHDHHVVSSVAIEVEQGGPPEQHRAPAVRRDLQEVGVVAAVREGPPAPSLEDPVQRVEGEDQVKPAIAVEVPDRGAHRGPAGDGGARVLTVRVVPEDGVRRRRVEGAKAWQPVGAQRHDPEERGREAIAAESDGAQHAPTGAERADQQGVGTALGILIDEVRAIDERAPPGPQEGVQRQAVRAALVVAHEHFEPAVVIEIVEGDANDLRRVRWQEERCERHRSVEGAARRAPRKDRQALARQQVLQTPAVEGPSRPPEAPAQRSPRRLSEAEEQRILDALHEPRFADQAPAEVYAALLDEGRYLGSIRTLYRVLHRHAEVRERRALTMRPNYQRPELLATRPNQLWSWDITKLRGPGKWTYYC